MMAKIYKFPERERVPNENRKAVPQAAPSPYKLTILDRLVAGVWAVFVLTWPVIQWVWGVLIFFQIIKTWYHWPDPNNHSGWILAGMFLGLAVAQLVVAGYQPRAF
jgi:hypothetical protein